VGAGVGASGNVDVGGGVDVGGYMSSNLRLSWGRAWNCWMGDWAVWMLELEGLDLAVGV